VPLTADALLTLKLPVDELVVAVFVKTLVVMAVEVVPVVAVLPPPHPTTPIDAAKRVLRIKT
jgi:hypothetical protein